MAHNLGGARIHVDQHHRRHFDRLHGFVRGTVYISQGITGLGVVLVLDTRVGVLQPDRETEIGNIVEHLLVMRIHYRDVMRVENEVRTHLDRIGDHGREGDTVIDAQQGVVVDAGPRHLAYVERIEILVGELEGVPLCIQGPPRHEAAISLNPVDR